MAKRKVGAIDKIIGGRIKSLRKDHGYSQAVLGEKLGISFQQIQKYETGDNRVSASTLLEIANFFKVSVLYFYNDLVEVNLPAFDPEIIQAAKALKSMEKETRRSLCEIIHKLAA